jgi:dihydroorotate dehydrogenase electron transfer subunit
MKRVDFNFCEKILITTMDGSCGLKGHSCTPLEREIVLDDYDVVYACGPQKMLENISNRCKEGNILCYVSLEEYMACGIGACLGCVCNTLIDGEKTYSRVCMEGPVFNSKEVLFNE